MNHTWTLLLSESWLMNTGRAIISMQMTAHAAAITAVATRPELS